MTRTDIHRPSSELFDPENYECFGVFDTHDEWNQDQRAKFQEVKRALDAGYRFAGHQENNVCGHCGARLRYVALMGHTPTKEMIYVGETCLDNRFESLTKGEFQALRKQAQLDREAHKLLDAFNALCEKYPVVAYASYAWNLADTMEITIERIQGSKAYRGIDTRPFDIMDSIAHKARQYGNVSPAQVALLEKLMGQVASMEASARQRVEATVEAADVPTGKILVEGRVLTTKWQDSQFGASLKMLVQHESGWKVWGTVSKSLTDVAKGDTVRFNANVEASDDDSKFGFFKRPTKAEITAKGESDD